MQKRKIAIVLAILCGIISLVIVIQIKTLKGVNSPVMQVIANDSLRDDVLKWKDKYDSSDKNLEKLEKKLEKVREEVVNYDESYKEKEQKIKFVLYFSSIKSR